MTCTPWTTWTTSNFWQVQSLITDFFDNERTTSNVKKNQSESTEFLAEVIEHIPLTLRTRYQFCCAPINRRMPLVCTMFLKIARRFSRGELLTYDWLCHQIGFHDVSVPLSILDLIHMEAVHDVFDLYLWLSYRYRENLNMICDTPFVMFPWGRACPLEVECKLSWAIKKGKCHCHLQNFLIALKRVPTWYANKMGTKYLGY